MTLCKDVSTTLNMTTEAQHDIVCHSEHLIVRGENKVFGL